MLSGKEMSRRYREKYPWKGSYSNAKQRCTNPKNKHYKNYGAKGVEFKLTMEYVGYLWHRDNAQNMKSPSIDRLNSKGSYVSGNCRFIEHSENVRLGSLAYWEKRNRAVIQIDFNGYVVKKWRSAYMAAKELDTSFGNIYSVLRGDRKHAKDFRWEYV